MSIDAIIIGAGPAGTAAALRIQQLGGTCILLDKHIFPRPKACAGMLSSLAIRHIPSAIIQQAISGISTEIEWIEGGSRTLMQERNGLTERIHLDHVMATTATGNGITLLNEQPVKIQPLPDKINVITSRRKLLSCRAIVCADGANSTCRQLLGLPVVSKAFAIEANLSFASASKRSLFDFDIIAGGYGWFFPSPGFANIGIASMIGSSKGLTTALRQFCQKHGLPTPEKNQIRGARIGAYGANTHLGSDSILLTGDAAGLADPYTGEGISSALLSGTFAGQAIMTSKIPGPTYHSLMQPTLTRLQQRLALAQSRGLAAPL